MNVSRTILLLLCIVAPSLLTAQIEAPDPEEFNSVQLEDLSETTESETEDQEDDYTNQQLTYLQRNPVPLNASQDELLQLPFLDPLLISNLLHYRRSLGELVSIYELQAVPGFSTDIIRKILPFVCLHRHDFKIASIRERFRGGDQTFLVRPVFVPEHFTKRDTTNVKFAGDPSYLMARYKYQYRNLLQYGLTVEKDAGEKLVHSKFPGVGDFRSFHLFIRDAGSLKAFAVGDFTVNLGQGLLQWQSQAFKKSSSVLNVKRQSETLRPYQSAGEYNFFRGIAVTFKKSRYETTLFASNRALTVNTDIDDVFGTIVTTIVTSGLHRTTGELQKKNRAKLFSTGGNIKRHFNAGHVAVNFVHHSYTLPLLKRDEAYNRFAVSGRQWYNGSIDFAFTGRSYHVFGECAVDALRNRGVVTGFLSSPNPVIDFACVYRNISKAYQSIYGNAFTENTMPSNESGLYSGVTVRINHQLKLDGYADWFYFPWLKYRVDAPSSGVQYLLQFTWKPSRKAELYSRIRYREKPLNLAGEEALDFPGSPVLTSMSKTDYPGFQEIANWRTHLSYQINRQITIRSRVEICQLSKSPGTHIREKGYLFLIDMIYKARHRPVSAYIRLMHFEGESYDARIYAYENDLLMVSSTPAWFGSGFRWYINIRHSPMVNVLKNSRLSFSLKIASTVYSDRSSIITGGLSISGNRKSDIKFQVIFSV